MFFLCVFQGRHKPCLSKAGHSYSPRQELSSRYRGSVQSFSERSFGAVTIQQIAIPTTTASSLMEVITRNSDVVNDVTEEGWYSKLSSMLLLQRILSSLTFVPSLYSIYWLRAPCGHFFLLCSRNFVIIAISHYWSGARFSKAPVT